MLSVEAPLDRNSKKLPHQSSSSYNPTLLRIGQVSALPIMLTGLLDPNVIQRIQCHHNEQPHQSTASNSQIVNNKCEKCRQKAEEDEEDAKTENAGEKQRKSLENQQPIRFLAYKVNDKFREMLTPIPNKRFYSPLPQTLAEERRNSDESSA